MFKLPEQRPEGKDGAEESDGVVSGDAVSEGCDSPMVCDGAGSEGCDDMGPGSDEGKVAHEQPTPIFKKQYNKNLEKIAAMDDLLSGMWNGTLIIHYIRS